MPCQMGVLFAVEAIGYLVNPGGRVLPPPPPKPGGGTLFPGGLPMPGGLVPPNPGGLKSGGMGGRGLYAGRGGNGG